ncbi:MAG: hypothetical protein GY772_04990 [bacterium]|nr:hypothetical protein [bacterium]
MYALRTGERECTHPLRPTGGVKEPKLLFRAACRANTEISTKVDSLSADLRAEPVGQLGARCFRGSDQLVFGGIGFKAQRPDEPNEKVDARNEPKPNLVLRAGSEESDIIDKPAN